MAGKTVIIGGVAGGATAAARLRRRDNDREIIMFERGEYISYANCGLPYHIGDVIASRDALLLQTPEAMKAKYKIDVRILSEVTEICPEEKRVIVKDLTNDTEYEESYDDLIIATGSSPLKPPIKGIDRDNIFTLWTIPNMDDIKTFIRKKRPKTAAVIGGGFIGLEMAENLHEAGLKVTMIEMMNQVMAPLDYEMAQLLHENMRMNEVNLILEDGVQEFVSEGGKTAIQLKSGKQVMADMVILSIGVKPNSVLAREAGLELTEHGGILVDEYLRTSNENIYAVGDVIAVKNFVTNDRTMIPLAGPANKQGRIAADNIAGDSKKYNGSLGTAVAKVFDLNAASVGLNEKMLKGSGKEKDKDYFTVLVNQRSHAGYYPGATPLTLKMLFEKSGKILGAQVVGQDGVDKRIDVLATTMRLGGTIYDLTELELAYAPPFSSAKDPVNMLGFVAENVLSKKAAFIEWDELDRITKFDKSGETFTILDVTEEMERAVFHIQNSYHIPLGSIQERYDELDQNKKIIVYCAIGIRSYTAARVLMQKGFDKVQVLSGGTLFYKSMHHADRMLTAEREERSMRERELVAAETDISAEASIKMLDCCGMQCPGPIMKVNETVAGMSEGEVLKVSATDMGFASDIESWCRRTGNSFIKKERIGKENIVYLKRGSGKEAAEKGGLRGEIRAAELPAEGSQGKTIIVFSGDLDKVLASFIIANGAAAMGRPVTMFFTFWGLNALRKHEKIRVKKPFLDRMFGSMMPRGTKRLKLSNMNMAGMGTKMMKKVMRDKNVDTLEDLMKQGMANGIKLVACTMSMDVMGITKDELIDGVELAGVASYLGDAEESNVNLFI